MDSSSLRSAKFTPRAFAAGFSAVLVLSLMLVGAVTVLAAPPSVAVNLDQCRNGGLVAAPGTQTFTPCTGGGSGNSGWVNGNAGASNAHYAEGESISYRARLTNLHVGDQVSLIMAYDVIHSGRHAIDYLTDKNRWQTPETDKVTTPDVPCSTVSGCTEPATTLLPITAPTTNIQVDPTKTLASGDCEKTGSGATQQPVTSFTNVPAAERVIEIFGGNTASFSYVGPNPNLLDHNGTQQQQVQVTFTATTANPVLAWGGHIARAVDWGCLNAPQSASGISGSPYHMAINSALVNSIPVNLGNQDRSLSAAAVVVSAPTLPTTQSAGGAIGTVLNDTATITGGNNPTGTVTFNLYGPNDTTCANAAIYTQVVNVSGGSATTSPGFTTTAAGTYEWTAHYSGDNTNLPADSACGAEAVTIDKASPTLPTTPSETTGDIGDVLNDTATVTGGSSPTGSIDFALYGPDDTNCEGTAIYTQTVALTGASATTSPGFTTLAAGTYEWTAHYGGDDNNNSADSACGAEAVVIGKNAPTAATTQSLIPNDKLTLTGATSDAGGTVDFYLFFDDQTCDVTNIANAVFTEEDVALAGNDHASTSNDGVPANDGFTASDEGTYTWLAIYSGDGNNDPATSDCVETFTIDNG